MLVREIINVCCENSNLKKLIVILCGNLQIFIILTAFWHLTLPCFKGLILGAHYFLCKSEKRRTWMKDTNNVCAQCCKSALITEDNCYFSQIKRRETPYLFVYFLGCDYFNRSGSITPSMIAKKKSVLMNVVSGGSALI